MRRKKFELLRYSLLSFMQCADLWPNLAQGKTPSGGGGLLSTGNDYVKFAECLTRGGVSESGFRWRIGILPENAVVGKILLGHIADCCGRRPWT